MVRRFANLARVVEPLVVGLDLHAWAEVRVPEVGWLPVDPALGQPIADATHLPLARGRDLERAMAILASETRIELVAVR